MLVLAGDSVIRKLLIVYSLLFTVNNAHAVFTVASSSASGYSSGTPIISSTSTWDAGALTNGLLVVGIGTHDTAPGFTATVNSIKWGGTQLSFAVAITSTSGNNDIETEFWYLTNPASGSNDLVITYNANINRSYRLASFWNGANQTQGTVLDQIASGTGATDPTASITPGEDNELIVSHYLSEAATVLTVGAGETLITEIDFGSQVSGGSYAIQTTAGAQTVDWAGTDSQWSMVVASFKQAAGAAAAPKCTPPLSCMIGGF